jgi:hypothetical protein
VPLFTDKGYLKEEHHLLLWIVTHESAKEEAEPFVANSGDF